MTKIRIGQGFDAHKWQIGKQLVLGGIKIPYSAGLEAHSDGDAVIHALCDALLGAAGLGDIGYHFPDTQSAWENIDSRILLRQVIALLENNNYQVCNADITVLAEEPKLAPYREQMQINLALDMKISANQVNIKASTTEKMGFIGRKEGIASLAIALITSI